MNSVCNPECNQLSSVTEYVIRLILMSQVPLLFLIKGNINKWYNGKHELGAEMITYIAKALHVSEDEIRLGIKPETDYLKDEIWRLIPFFRN